MNDKILVLIKEDHILISNNGKRLIIDSEDLMFNELKTKTKEEILEWYASRK
jgi:hypothetical protein